MNTIENTTQRLYNQINGKDKNTQEVFIDPITISILSNIIIGIVKLYIACKKNPDEAVQIAHRPGPRERSILNRELRKQFGWFNWKKKREYCDHIIQYGADIQQDEMQGLYNDYHTCIYTETR
jgi:hypothetical protein